MLTPLPTDPKLYGILDLGYLKPEELETATHELIAGGADLLQLRAKGHEPGEVLAWARSLLPICRKAKIPFIINDHAAVAAEVGADGLHIGQDDGSLTAARAIIGPELILGRSTHSVEQAEEALADGFDYIGFGPLFPTPTKKGRPGIGIENVSKVEDTIGQSIPVFCIGGIKRSNLLEVTAAGAKRIVIVSDLLTAPEREAAARAAKNQL